jgi:predicted peptidase
MFFIFLLFFSFVSSYSRPSIRVKKISVKKEYRKKVRVFKINIAKDHYWLVLPRDFSNAKKYPVVLYLHGRKYDPPLSDRAALHLFTRWLPAIKKLKFALVLPTLPLRSYPTWTMRDNPFLVKVVKDVRRRLNQSSSPLYFAGFSAGALHSVYVGLNNYIKVDGICAFGYGLAQNYRTIPSNVKNIPVFLAVGKYDRYIRSNVRYSYRVLKKIHFRDVTYKEYPIGHWVHEDFIKDIQKWVAMRSKQYFAAHNFDFSASLRLSRRDGQHTSSVN